jgi:hypothetical protein
MTPREEIANDENPTPIGRRGCACSVEQVAPLQGEAHRDRAARDNRRDR